MLESTKIKFLTVVGTFFIISTALVLQANSFYKELHPLEDIVTKIENPDKPKTIKTVKSKKLVSAPKIENVIEKDTLHIEENVSLAKTSKKPRYIHLDKDGELSQESKDILTKMLPELLSLKDSYIEIEGHCATKLYDYLTQKESENAALKVQNYLSSKISDTEIIITGYGDKYPIIDDKKDKRNSRIELKIRRR